MKRLAHERAFAIRSCGQQSLAVRSRQLDVRAFA